MVQWVKNLTAAAWVTEEVQILSLVWCSGLKDPAFPHLWCRWQLQLRFGPLVQELPYAMRAAIKKKKKSKNCESLGCTLETYIILYIKYASIKKHLIGVP